MTSPAPRHVISERTADQQRIHDSEADISVAVANPERKPPKMSASPKAAMPPLAVPETLAVSAPTTTGARSPCPARSQ